MAKAVNWQSRNQHLNGKIPFRLKSSCGQLKAGFRGKQGIYPWYPLTAAWNANNLKAFLLLIVRIGAAFSCRWLFLSAVDFLCTEFTVFCPVGTICREANRKYSGRRHIPPRRPEEYSCRRRSCSTRVPVYAFGGTADNSSPESDCG